MGLKLKKIAVGLGIFALVWYGLWVVFMSELNVGLETFRRGFWVAVIGSIIMIIMGIILYIKGYKKEEKEI